MSSWQIANASLFLMSLFNLAQWITKLGIWNLRAKTIKFYFAAVHLSQVDINTTQNKLKLFFVMSWSYMTNHVMDLTWSRQFYIITYPKVDLLLIIHHLTYLINIPNPLFKSSFQINFFNQLFEINPRNLSSHWIGSATAPWYVTSSINIRT